jgi:hypothetical protein
MALAASWKNRRVIPHSRTVLMAAAPSPSKVAIADGLEWSYGWDVTAARTMAEAISAPVVTLFHTYDVQLGEPESAYRELVMALPEILEWIEAARHEPNGTDELEVEF